MEQENRQILFVALYVADLMFALSCTQFLADTKRELANCFKMKGLRKTKNDFSDQNILKQARETSFYL